MYKKSYCITPRVYGSIGGGICCGKMFKFYIKVVLMGKGLSDELIYMLTGLVTV